jgi:CIC family chloride channel protein
LKVSLKHTYQSFSNYLRIRFNRIQFMMFVAAITGLISGLLAVLLKTIVHYIEDFVFRKGGNFLYLIFPLFGLLITVFIIQNFFKGYIERGIGMVLRSIAKRSSFIPFRNNFIHIITSAITVGSGGSAGLESPIVATGSSVGSTIGRWSNVNYQERTLLIACGAAAGIAAVFNAPVAGVIFAIEILLAETVLSYFIPLIVAAVTGALCSKIILKENILFNFMLRQSFDYKNVPFYIVLGILAGFVSVYYARAFRKVEDKLGHWKINPYSKAIVGGILLLAIYYFLAPLFGEGYFSVRQLANGTPGNISRNESLLSYLNPDWGLVLFAALIVLAKPVAAAITIGSGGNGGNFAPSLFSGSFLGFFFAKLMNTIGFVKLPESNFSLVGMAGVLSGVMYAPLTAIFLIAEITNGYELMIPLMIVSIISFFIVKHFEPYSMEIKQLAIEGEIFTHKKEGNILTTMNLESILTDKYQSIPMDRKLKDLIDIIKRSEKNIYAVEDRQGRFIGIIELNDIKQKIFNPELFEKTTVRELMKKPPDVIRINEQMQRVMEKFDLAQSWYLPVLDNDGKFVGFISKSKIFSQYREALAAQNDLYDE